MDARLTKFVRLCVSLIVVPLLAASSYAAIDPGTIIGAWLFDEGDGGTAGDSSGNGVNGELQGCSWVDGKVGKALEFNGTSDWVDIPKKIGAFDQVTITAWVNCTGRVGQWRVIFNNNGWKAGDIHHQLHTNNLVEFSINGNPQGNDTFGTLIFNASQLNIWHHLATVYSSEGWIRFYVDGQLDVENAWGGSQATFDAGRIGSWDGGGREWQGMLDEIIFFNAVLEEDDIRTLMDKGLAAILSVEPAGKLAFNWGSVKAGY